MTQPNGNDPDTMDWRQIQTAIIGTSFSSDKQKDGQQGWDNLTTLDTGLSEPASLYAASLRFHELLIGITILRANLTAQRNALVGSGQWSGAAADGFAELMKYFDRVLEQNTEPLTGLRSYSALLNNSALALQTAINDITELNYQGAREAKAEYDRLKKAYEDNLSVGDGFTTSSVPPPVQPWFQHNGQTIYTPSTYPHIDKSMTDRARTIMTTLITKYMAAARDFEPPSGASMPSQTNLPSVQLPTQQDLSALSGSGTLSTSGLPVSLPSSPGIDMPSLASSPQLSELGSGGLPGSSGGLLGQAATLPTSPPLAALPGFGGIPGAFPGGSTSTGNRPGTQGAGIQIPRLPDSPPLPGFPGTPGIPGSPSISGASIPPITPAIPKLPDSPPLPAQGGTGLPGSPSSAGGGFNAPRLPDSPAISPAFPFSSDAPGGGVAGGVRGLDGGSLTSGGPSVGAGPISGGAGGGMTGGMGGLTGGMGGMPMGGMPMMPPMMPMSPGGGGGNNEERERTTWLLEDRDLWSVDALVSPGVVTAGAVDREDETSYVVSATDTPAERTYGPGRTAETHRQQQSY